MIKVFDKSPSKHGTLDDLSQIYAQQLLLKNSICSTPISKTIQNQRDASCFYSKLPIPSQMAAHEYQTHFNYNYELLA